MLRCLKPIDCFVSLPWKSQVLLLPRCNIRGFTRQQVCAKSTRTRESNTQTGKWFLLIIPMSGFGLGTWQVYRKKWKLDLIRQLEERTNSNPKPFPDDLNKLKDLEYFPICVRGTFDHGKEIYIGPRSLVKTGPSIDSGSLMSTGNKNIGAQVITPFHLADSDTTILVNRGFVPSANKNPKTRPEGQVEGTTKIVGLLRHNEKRPPLSPKNMPSAGRWLYKDLNDMSELTGASPILIDAVYDATASPQAPIGGQTRVTLRDEHLSYIVTWYGLSIATAVMWYYRFIK